VALARFPEGREVVAEGVVEGVIAEEPRGVGGFGYDPVFLPEGGDGRTFAEMTSEQKNSLSHRALAFARLAELLAS
jgi:XTP/dITP diphosphohydrolase